MLQQSANWRELNGKDGKYRISKYFHPYFSFQKLNAVSVMRSFGKQLLEFSYWLSSFLLS